MKKKRQSAARRKGNAAAAVEGLLLRGGIVFGHDPGAEGATVALLLGHDGRLELLGFQRNPSLVWSPESSSVRRRCLDGAALAEFLSSIRAARADLEAIAVLERVSPRPAEGPVGAFGFGGWQHGPRVAFAIAGLPTALPVPRTWQKVTGVEALAKAAGVDSKEAAVRIASTMFPSLASTLRVKAAQGVADAALIAAYGALVAGPPTIDAVSRGG